MHVVVYLILSGLKPFFDSSPDSISAMANFVDKLNPSNLFGYIAAAIFGVAWRVERSGKKESYKKSFYSSKTA